MEFAGLPNWNRPLSLENGTPSSIAVPQNYLNQFSQLHNRASSLVVIDPTVPNYQQLAAGIQPDTHVLILDPAQDAIAQITQALLGQTGISSLHLVSHGRSGAIQLGETWLDRTALDRYQSDFQQWAKSLTEDADILIYGCDVAQGDAGRALITQFSRLTGADISASDDLTGNAALNGDWTLEVNTGDIGAQLAFTAETRSNYAAILPVDLISVGNPTLAKGSVGLESIGRNSVSGDGRYIVFTSRATLSANDANGVTDVFLYDRQADTVTLVSRNATNTGSATGASLNPAISYDGNYVAFVSNANDLVSSMTSNTTQASNIFVWERSTGNITLVSRGADGKSGLFDSSAPSISDDGSRIAFQTQAQLLGSDPSSVPDVYVWDRSTSALTHISNNRTDLFSPTEGAESPVISGDGNYVAFTSLYSNLSFGDSNTSQDVFLWQQSDNTLYNLTMNPQIAGNADSRNPVISRDGRRVAFTSDANNFAPDTNNVSDVFVWTRSGFNEFGAPQGSLQLVSINSAGNNSGNGAEGFGNNPGSQNPVISRNGDAIAFTSSSTNLVAGDTNDKIDVFVRNLVSNQTVLVSRGANGIGNGDSGNQSLSEDGTRIAFTSDATNLVAGDTNAQQDVFVRDISTGKPDSEKTFLISRTPAGAGGNNASGTTSSEAFSSISVPVISGDGNIVAFVSLANNLNTEDNNALSDGFVIPVTSGNATLISRRDDNPDLASRTGSGSSTIAPHSLSADGRYIVFTSAAPEIVDGDTNGVSDVFLRDRQTGTTTLISKAATIANGASGNAMISSDGRYVVFTSAASNLVGSDNNNAVDIFWVDRQTSQLRLVSRAAGGANSANAESVNPVLSANGLFVAFTSTASNLVSSDTNNQQDVFLWNSQDDSIAIVSRGSAQSDGASEQPVISADGRYVAFVSAATNLVSGDTNAQRDVFMWDRQTNAVTLVSRASGVNGAVSDGDSYQVSISQDGRTIAFTSTARNLTGTPDADGDEDVFVRNLDTNATVHASANRSGGYSVSLEFSLLKASNPMISGDGQFVVFASDFEDLVANDANGVSDIFRRNLATGVTELVSVNKEGTSSGNNASGADGGTGSGSGRGSLDPMISTDGRLVIFNSFSSDLADGDTNNALDAFVRDMNAGFTTLVSQIPSETNSGRGASFNPVLSGNGNYIAFNSLATDLTPRDLNSSVDVFGLNLETTVSLTLDKPTIAENTPANTVQYKIRRNRTNGDLTVKLAIDPSSTAAGGDYTLTADPSLNLTRNESGITIKLANGVAEGVITLSAIDDIEIEPEETLNLSLIAAPEYAIADSFGTTSLKITDNDIPILVSVSNVTTDSTEGNTGEKEFTFQVKLSAPATTAPVTVRYATQTGTADATDFTTVSDTLTFNVGDPDTKTITVRVKGDTQFEPDETFSLVLSDPSANARLATNSSATATIANDDTVPTITIAGADSITEGDTGTQAYTFTISLSEASSTEVKVDYALRDLTTVSGTDYVAVPAGTLAFAPGVRTQTITVLINGDRLYEDNEQFQIELSNPVGASLPDEQKLKTGAITDNDTAPSITIETASQQSEATSPYNFVVKLSEASGRPVTVKYDTIDGTATAGEDFTAASNTLTFAAGETEKTIEIPVTNDTKREQNETFSVKLTDAANATITTDTATATIADDDPVPTVAITNGSQVEGNSGDTPLQFTVTLSNASDQEIVLNYETKDGTAIASDSDYQSSSGTIKFAPGTTSQTITVNAKGDTKRERDETFALELTTATPNLVTIPATAIGVGTIQNDDTTLPTISVSPATVSEGGVLTFTVSLSDTSSDEIRVNVATSDGTATLSDSDYTERTSETLVFVPNEQTKTITVQTTSDNKLEEDETIALTLTNPVNATLAGSGSAIGTIRNDDQRPTIGIASTPLSEDDPQAAAYPFTIRLSNPTTQTVTVKYRTIDDTATVADSDYVTVQGTVTFNPGEVEKTITVKANSDRKFEPTERFIVRLEDPVNADLATSATDGFGVLNNDDAAPQLSIVSRTGTQAEGNSGRTSFEFVVSLNNPSSEEIRVNYATIDGTASGSDYEAANGTLIFAPGEEQETITVNVLGDTVLEPEESFLLRLSNPTNATISGSNEARGTILNDDQAIRPTIQIEDVIASEGSVDTTYTFKVKLSQATTNPVSVQYRTLDDTAAIADNDYIGIATPETLTFAPGEVEKQFSVVVRGDTKFEPNETFFAELINPTNADLSSVNRARGVINNDDARPTISIGNVVVSEGNVEGTFTNATFTVSLSNSSSEAISVNYTTVDETAQAADNDYETAAGRLTFAPGVTSQQITVRVRGDRKFEPDESFSIQLSSPTNADLFTAINQGIGTILGDDFRPTMSIDDATPVLEGNVGATPVRFTVRLSNASSEVVTTKYATKNGTANSTDYAGVTTPTTLTFAPGQTEQTITVQAIGDVFYELDEAFTVELSDSSNAQITDGSATATIQNDDPLPKLSIAAVATSNPEGNSGITPFTFEVSLSEASPTPITVNYTTVDGSATLANNDYVKAADTLTFAPGETKKTVIVNILGDALFEGNETFQVSLSNPTNATLQTNVATATIVEDDTPPTMNNNSPYDIFWRNQFTGQNLLWQPAGSLLDRELSLATIPDPRWKVVGTADFNGDGAGDLLWRNSTTGDNAIWCMNADLVIQGSFLPTIAGAWQITGIGDFNRDRKADILWRNPQTGENAIWFMRDTVVNTGTFIFKVSDPSWKVSQVADFNNDGSSDIVWTNSSTGEVALWLMDGATIKEDRLEKVSDLAWRIVAAGDINRDGFVDLLWRNDRTGENAMWLMRNGQVERGAFLPSVPPTNWQIESLFDFNGDQSLDILWRNGTTQETVIWFLNQDQVGTTAYLPNLPDRNWSIQAVSRFSNQSKGEIMMRNSQTGENRIWRISLDWFDRSTVLDPQIDRDWQVQGTADFDRNGSADILWRNLRTRELSVWLTQNGQVRDKVTIPAGFDIPIDWVIQGIGDFSGDGSPDLIWRNRRTGETAMWLLNGTQVTSGLFLPKVDTSWQIQDVADMNADRNLDLIWRNPATGQTAIWLFDRTDVTRGIFLPAISPNWQIKGFADFNRDGQTDLVWRDDSTGEIALWFMNAGQVSRGVFLPSAPTNWDLIGVGDFNRDNQFDLLWRDRGSGSNAVWYLVNNSVTFATYVPSLTDLGWQLEGIDDF
ncbi:DUF4347 domain-containing protein [Leptolyngbya sp. DQ-M1]|uniref:Calx-beta domain-containing protein n=1 Tax=Leptolyngbya sp. DQ-M1 TaxID=2933920 RepID=UPI0032989095